MEGELTMDDVFSTNEDTSSTSLEEMNKMMEDYELKLFSEGKLDHDPSKVWNKNI